MVCEFLCRIIVFKAKDKTLFLFEVMLMLFAGEFGGGRVLITINIEISGITQA